MRLLQEFLAQALIIRLARRRKQRHLTDSERRHNEENWQPQWRPDQASTRYHVQLVTCPITQAHALTWRTFEAMFNNKQNRQFHFMQFYLA